MRRRFGSHASPSPWLAQVVAAVALTACGASVAPVLARPPAAATPSASSTTLASPVAPPETFPTRLPADTRPTSESLVLTVDPRQERFSGAVDIAITLDHPRSVVWLHGKDLHVTRATATPEGMAPRDGRFEQRDEGGLASLTLAQPLPAGRATLHLEYDAAFGHQLKGLYEVSQAGVPYAFTQLESVYARQAFPCFDEPAFKVPFETTLVIPEGANAVANGREVERRREGDRLRVRFAPTPPLPSYLVAFGVGPIDVVDAPDVAPNAVRARPLPLRAVTARGRGKEAAFALSHVGELLATLETFFGLPYPFDKLDLIAVPERGGAMENPGAIMFTEERLLFDEKTAPVAQRRGYARTMAHELAHQWVGNLVTASWWDDLWLNEAFATWAGAKAVDAWDPSAHAAASVLDDVQWAMSDDAQVSARAIRQPVSSVDDIVNAFDGITYQKGAGVLSMFERWVGPEVFRRGLHDYLTAHAFGSATADDFLAAESAAAGRDVATAFRTFLDQPGVPFLEGQVVCDAAPHLHLRQSRFLPLGSVGDPDRTWQIPICVRYGAGKDANESCALLADREGDVGLGGKCPDWVFPNAEASGYFRFALDAGDLAKLRGGFAALDSRERAAFGDSLGAGVDRGTIPIRDAILASAPLARDPDPNVAHQPMGLLLEARRWLADDAAARTSLERYGRALFRPAYRELGWTRAKGDDLTRVRLRASVLQFLGVRVNDVEVRAEAKRRALAFLGYGKDGALHPDAVDPDLAVIALWILGEDADPPVWEAMYAQLVKAKDVDLRGKLLWALSSPRSPQLSARVRDLTFDPALLATEITTPLWGQMRQETLREATWAWIKENLDTLLAKVPGSIQLLSMTEMFCDEAHAKDVESTFTAERLAKIPGGPRTLASALESVRLCTAKRRAQEPSARDAFTGGGPGRVSAVRKTK